jgi:4-carboxymuconolactone decarboxylase
MVIDELLARPGLARELRLLVAAAAAIWRADWSTFRQCAERARDLGQARADFEETLLQAVLFCGFPRVVTAFEQLGEVWPGPPTTIGGELPVAEQRTAGAALFAGIYGKNAADVAAMLRGFHPEFHAFVLEAAYGRILTRPHLAARERELLAVGLLAAQGQKRQFAGHARGALHFGADRAQIHEAVVTALAGGSQPGASQIGGSQRGGSQISDDASSWLQLVR